MLSDEMQPLVQWVGGAAENPQFEAFSKDRSKI